MKIELLQNFGLMLIKQTKNLGLKELIEISGYKEINSNCIGFGIGPRINASGRMGMADKGLDLFLSTDKEEVKLLANELNELNKLRQETEKEIIEAAINQIENEKLYLNKTLVVTGENWHHGVIGIVSSKITDMYFKPSVLLSFEEDGIGKGSGRSIPGFNIHSALTKCKDKIEKFGRTYYGNRYSC